MEDNEKPNHPQFNYDKLIAESDGLYRQWWMMWKDIHPDWALLPEADYLIEPLYPMMSSTHCTTILMGHRNGHKKVRCKYASQRTLCQTGIEPVNIQRYHDLYPLSYATQ